MVVIALQVRGKPRAAALGRLIARTRLRLCRRRGPAPARRKWRPGFPHLLHDISENVETEVWEELGQRLKRNCGFPSGRLPCRHL
jgi:hypothetical protein